MRSGGHLYTLEKLLPGKRLFPAGSCPCRSGTIPAIFALCQRDTRVYAGGIVQRMRTLLRTKICSGQQIAAFGNVVHFFPADRRRDAIGTGGAGGCRTLCAAILRKKILEKPENIPFGTCSGIGIHHLLRPDTQGFAECLCLERGVARTVGSVAGNGDSDSGDFRNTAYCGTIFSPSGNALFSPDCDLVSAVGRIAPAGIPLSPGLVRTVPVFCAADCRIFEKSSGKISPECPLFRHSMGCADHA